MSPAMRCAQPEVSRHYMRMQVETAGHNRRITLLHEKCVDLMQAAIDNGIDRRLLLDRAQNILVQLMSAVDPVDSVNRSLAYLYDYSYVRLDRGTLDDIRGSLAVMTPLRDSFRTLLLS